MDDYNENGYTNPLNNPYYRKKVFVPPRDPDYDPIKEKQREEEAEEHRKVLGREAQEIYREVLSTESRRKRKSKEIVHSDTPWFCEVCQDSFPSSMTVKEHNRSVVHLFNEKETPRKTYIIQENNKGYQMLKNMEWEENKGLGPEGHGRLDPVQTQYKTDRKGLGAGGPLPYRVTHFKPGEIPASHESPKHKSERKRLTKYQKKLKERYDKNREQAIRNVVFN